LNELKQDSIDTILEARYQRIMSFGVYNE
jgi:hypothetical protein